MLRLAFVALLLTGCAVDASGIPGRNADEDAAITDAAIDLSVPDGPLTPDLGTDLGMAMEDDLGIDMGPPDLGPPDLGPPDLGPPDLGPPDLGPPDLGPPDLGPPDMFMDGGCGMPETCNAVDDDCDGAIDERPGGPRGENGCPACTRAVSPGGITYQICSESTERWSAARDDCRGDGYELASLESAAEDSFVDSVLIGGQDYWIGANDRASEDTFVWIDGTPFGAFTNWAPGEPNNSDGGLGNGNCVRISRGDGNTWRDDDCSGGFQASHRFVCEAP